jgi:hypothetical protein
MPRRGCGPVGAHNRGRRDLLLGHRWAGRGWAELWRQVGALPARGSPIRARQSWVSVCPARARHPDQPRMRRATCLPKGLRRNGWISDREEGGKRDGGQGMYTDAATLGGTHAHGHRRFRLMWGR